jgi:hypothetical protein
MYIVHRMSIGKLWTVQWLRCMFFLFQLVVVLFIFFQLVVVLVIFFQLVVVLVIFFQLVVVLFIFFQLVVVLVQVRPLSRYLARTYIHTKDFLTRRVCMRTSQQNEKCLKKIRH